MGPVYLATCQVKKFQMEKSEIIQHGLNFVGRYKGPVYTELKLEKEVSYFIFKNAERKIQHFEYKLNKESADRILKDDRYAKIILSFKIDP